ncbi:MAG TPA: hypothetical protein VNM50_08355 [Chloroflexota bacterium]|nr:hypothetical protein [Chloroflexota bacterium]
MPAAPLNEAEVAAILAQPMRIAGTVQWTQKSHLAYLEAQLPAAHPRADARLSLRITVNARAREKYSVTLLLNGLRIRGLDVGGSHENRHTDRNCWHGQPHEHRWTDRCHDAWACAVDEPASLEAAVRDFCGRAGITFAATWRDLPGRQLDLEDL